MRVALERHNDLLFLDRAFQSLLFTSLEEKGVEADDDLGLEEEREVYVDKKDDDDKEEID